MHEIPILADWPSANPNGFSESEASTFVELIETHGWTNALRTFLANLSEANAKTIHMDLYDSYGIVTAMLAGRPLYASVLCLGCSSGAVPFALSDRFARVTVCDLSVNRLRILKARSKNEDIENIQFVFGGNTDYLPFATDTFDLILVDATVIPGPCLKRPGLWCELKRVVRPGGTCFVGASKGRSPKNMLGGIHATDRRRFLSPRFVQRMISAGGLECQKSVGLLPESQFPQVVFDLANKRHGRTQSFRPVIRERIKSFFLHNKTFVRGFGVIASNQLSKESPTFFEGVVLSAEESLKNLWPDKKKDAVMTRRIQVRKSGRIVIFATLGIDAGSPFIIKIPGQRWLLENEKRNVEALESIHNSDVIPSSIKRLVPIHLASGSLGKQPFYIESAVAGTATRKPIASRQVANLLMELNKITARTVTIGPAELQGVVDKIAVFRLAADNAAQRPTWLAIERFLTAEMLDQQVPVVWSHGDIGSSYLQDRKGNVSGIFDWETFDKNSFPLYDWTLLCVSRHGEGWNSVALALIGREDEFFKDLPLDNYLELLGVDRRLIPSLVLCAWIEYAAHRFTKRGCDPIWIRTTIVDVLNQCEKFLPATTWSPTNRQDKC